MLGTGNQELIANVQEIKKSQEALNTSKTEFEKENYDKKHNRKNFSHYCNFF